MYHDRIAKYIADYYIELGGKVDAIIFTAGIGENGIESRQEIIDRLAPLGFSIDAKVNDTIAGYRDIQEGIISDKKSKVEIWVVPTNEELMIAKDTYNLVK